MIVVAAWSVDLACRAVLRAPLLLLLLCAATLAAGDAGSARLTAQVEAAQAARAAARPPPARPLMLPAPPAGPIAISAVQRSAGADPVPRYGRLELTVAFAALSGTRPYEPDPERGGIDLQAVFTGPTGTAWRIPGFYDGSAWRIRFAPDTPGEWTYSVSARDSSGTDAWGGGSFTCAGGGGHGWVRVDGRWLRHADGTVFCPVGHNTGWQSDVEQPALAELAADAAGAPRLLSFWLCQPWTVGPSARAPIEQMVDGEWVYNQAACAYLDGVVARAEAAGVYLLPSIWIHDQLRDATHSWDSDGNWGLNPYRTIDPDPVSFFRLSAAGHPTEQWLRQQAFYRYLTARWGDSPALAGWVGLVELNGTNAGESDPALAAAWTVAVDDWFVAHDPYRSAQGSHPVAFSVTDWAASLVHDPDGALSVRAIDSYRAEVDDAQVAPVVAGEAQAAGGVKPVLFTEFGGRTTGNQPLATQPLHLHNGIWASFIAGAAMPALEWCDASAWPMLDAAMRAHLGHLAAFIGRQGWLGDAGQVCGQADLGAGADRMRGWYRRTGDRGALWLQRHAGDGDLAGASLAVVAADGRYACWWSDPWTGAESAPVEAAAIAGSLRLTAPSASGPDLAACWQRVPTPQGLALHAAPGARLRLALAPAAPQVLITRLPAHGRLWSTVDGVHAAGQITAVPALLSQHQVIYEAPAAAGGDAFAYAVRDGRLQGEAEVAVRIDQAASEDDGRLVDRMLGQGCGAGGFAGIAVIALIGLLRRRR